MNTKEYCKRGHRLSDTRVEDGNNGARRCGECRKIRQRLNWPKRAAKRPVVLAAKQSRHSHLKRTYGITIKEYDELYALQLGRCAICSKEETARNQHGILSLSVDHNHVTGVVRGLLCRECNSAIGKLDDNLELLRAATIYLEKYEISSKE